ncbi:MAG: ABC transporter permease [Betaproteobacteria bacterium]|nr:ABC transporter permease [Betaproteobacteria bacterium]
MTGQITTIARCTLLEARRTRLPELVLAAIVFLVAAGFFTQEIAITESARVRAGMYASGMRLAAVFIAGLYVLVSVMREFNDKGLDVVLALDVPRAHYILGKLAGFLIIGVLVAAAASLPLAGFATPESALQWGISLALELGIVIAFALFCVVTFNQLMPAASFVLAFYLLARTLTAIRLMSAHPLTGEDAASRQVIRFVVEGLGLIVPAFDRWTRTAWVADQHASWPDIGSLCASGILYITLLAAATMFDFHRRNF